MILKFPIIERVFIKECRNETIQFSEIALEGKMKKLYLKFLLMKKKDFVDYVRNII